MRLGWCPRTKEQVEEITASDWAQDVYLSPGDAGRFFAAAVEAPPNIAYAVVYATSRPLEKMYVDLEPHGGCSAGSRRRAGRRGLRWSSRSRLLCGTFFRNEE